MMDAQNLTEALQGRWHGTYGLAFCPAHENANTPALSLSNGRDGQLLAHCHAGCAFLAVVGALRARGLINGTGQPLLPDPFDLARRRKKQEQKQKLRADRARAVWEEAGPIMGTIAETYLRQRAISCTLPETLRFHPSCWHSSGERLPALVARIDGSHSFAVHRTYLTREGRKAETAPVKAMLGACKGGAVRLTGGSCALVVAEGIETGLSLSCGLLSGATTIWAALSATGMESLTLPAEPSRLIIASDSDDTGAGLRAASALAQRASGLGWTVSLLPAPAGQDWNDYLKKKGGAQ